MGSFVFICDYLLGGSEPQLLFITFFSNRNCYATTGDCSLKIDACTPPKSCRHTPFSTPTPTASHPPTPSPHPHPVDHTCTHTRDGSWLINIGSEQRAFLACPTPSLCLAFAAVAVANWLLSSILYIL